MPMKQHARAVDVGAGIYDTYRTSSLLAEIGPIGRALGLVTLLLVAAVFLLKHEALPRLLFIL